MLPTTAICERNAFIGRRTHTGVPYLFYSPFFFVIFVFLHKYKFVENLYLYMAECAIAVDGAAALGGLCFNGE